MTAHLGDWLNLLLRWAHLIAGIAWIGSSFYFIWLDSKLTAPAPLRERVEGEVWMVHSGGFYLVERRRLGPGRMPPVLHWFKWEAAITWITGIALLAIVYYLSGGVFLVDPAVSSIGVGQAIALAVALLVVSWFGYDALWNSRVAEREGAATGLSLALLAGVVFGLCRALSGRAAFIHVGAMLGTLMVANVWLRILPAQQRMIDATAAGREADYTEGERAKRRSVHNTYMTYPVLFIMLSNHFPATYGHRLNWLILALLIVAGAAVRHAMVAGASPRSGRWALVSALASLAVVVGLTVPRRPAAATGAGAVFFAEAREIINRRCLSCHSAYPTDGAFTTAPLGVTFDTPEQIANRAERIRARAVETRTMPLANQTGMTDRERDALARWIALGAPLR
jgi:uncharacterized membrane protein